MKPHNLHSAGGAVLRVGAAGLEVLVVHINDPAQWRLPKGKLAPGEAASAAALREIREESGVLAEIVVPAGETEHSFTQGAVAFHKRVTWFALRPVSPTTSPADTDFDRVVWMRIGDALAKLTFENERQVVRRAVDTCGHSR